jgi:hypothetical protein
MFLITSSLWVAVVLIVVIPTLLAMAGPIVIRRWVGFEKLRVNNEVAGFKFATVGVIYAVLLAFAVIVVWEKFSDAESDVTREGGAAATVYRIIDGVEGEAGRKLRAEMTAYLEVAIAEDWPAMERGSASDAVTRALNTLYATALTYSPTDQRGAVVLSGILNQLNIMTEARRARLVKASGTVPGVIWFVLCSGALVTIGFTLFFGAENLRAQTIMTGGLALLIFSGLLVIVAIDHPFSGTVKVRPEALVEVLRDLGRPNPPSKP